MASKQTKQTKQINGRVPPFMRDEYDELKVELRKIGSKPTDGDLLAALVHAALDAVEQTKAQVEDYVRYELEKEQAD
jgi:hypothetical protein